MLSDSDRKKAADILLTAEKDRKPALQLSKTFPDITIEDAYAISTEVTKHKIAAGAKLIGHKIGLTSKAMQQSSQIDEPDYGHLLDNMLVADGAKVPHADYCVPRVEPELTFVLRQAAQGSGRRAGRRAAGDRIRRARRSRSSTRACRIRARSSTPWRTTALPPAS